jgi:hypothetical protein
MAAVRILLGAQSDDQADGGDHQFGRCPGDGVGERVSRCGGAQVEPAIGAHQRRGRGGGERGPDVASVSQPAGQGEPDRDRDVQAGPGGVPVVGDGQVWKSYGDAGSPGYEHDRGDRRERVQRLTGRPHATHRPARPALPGSAGRHQIPVAAGCWLCRGSGRGPAGPGSDTSSPPSGAPGWTGHRCCANSPMTGMGACTGNDLLIHPGPVRAEVRIWVLVVPAVQDGCEGRGLRAACGQVPL